MLMLSVGLLLAIDVIIITVYMTVQGLMGSLNARLADFGENPEDVEGVRASLFMILRHCWLGCRRRKRAFKITLQKIVISTKNGIVLNNILLV